MLEKLRNTIDTLVLELNKKDGYIEAARKVYENPFHGLNIDLDIDSGFNNWIIHDYKDQKGYLVDQMDMDVELSNSVKHSLISVFKVHLEKVNIVFKDIITGEDFIINSDQMFEDGDLIKVRLYPVDNHYTILDNPDFFNPALEATIRKSVMSQYNRYCSMNEPVDIRVFVKEQSQYIYHLANIIEFYESEMEDDETLYVYTAVYGIEDKEAVLDILLDHEAFQLVEQYEDETTIMLYNDGLEVAEILVLPKRIEVDAKDQALRELAKEYIETTLKEKAAKIKEDILSLDDIL